MKIPVIGILLLVLLVALGGCSSSRLDGSAQLAAADPSAAGARSVSSLGWGSTTVVDSQPWGGHREGSSLALIGGDPAVSYIVWSLSRKSANYTLYYARANDSIGSSWGRPKALTSWPAPKSGGYWSFTSLCEVNGNPAIGYQDTSDPQSRVLKYIRAKDSTGKRWNSPVTVDNNGDTGLFATMKVVNGNPAIVYKDWWTTSYYVRALDPDGDSWGTPVEPDPSVTQIVIDTLAIVDGKPAVSYEASPGVRQLRYVRATDASGDSWGSPLIVQSGASDYRYRRKTLAVVGGLPAIAYGGDWNDTYGVYFVRALDADGTAWPADAVTVMDASSLAWHGSLAVINGLPSIAFLSTDTPESPSPVSLNFIQALEVTGGAWGTPQSLAGIGTMVHEDPNPVLAEAAPGAGIAFMDTTHAMNYIYGQ